MFRAIESTKAVLPIEGRAATMIRSDNCQPSVTRSSAVKPDGTPLYVLEFFDASSICISARARISFDDCTERFTWPSATLKISPSAKPIRSVTSIDSSYERFWISVAERISSRWTYFCAMIFAWNSTFAAEPTFWVVLIYGLFVNMQNYGIDQNYVQRYMTTKSLGEAVKSTLFGGLLYIPVSLVFVYIGTALFSYYTAQPDLLPAGTPADQVFPYFIVHGLPTGLTGLVIASLFSAGMSTIATSINSSATIVLTDFVRRLSQKEPTEKKKMAVLYATSFVVGALGIVVGLLMMSIDGVLDAWWKLSSIFSGGMLGLFLLGLVCKTVRRAHAVVAVILGLLTIAWMSLSPLINEGSPFYCLRSPLHTYLTIVFGTTVIFLVGFLLTKLSSLKKKPE